VKILEEILRDKLHSNQLIVEFQQMVSDDKDLEEILSQLAYDLDFYEHDEKLRS